MSQHSLIKENGIWVLRIERPNGKVQEYRSASEVQIRQLQTLFTSPLTMPQTAA